jgi:membrane-associated protein
MTMPRRGVLIGAGVVAALIAVVAILSAIGDGFTLVVADPASRAYWSVFLLIAGDAVIPVFPGETTLNAASTLAAQGTLALPLVIVAGALGAIVGDSMLFGIARRNAHRVRPQLERAQSNQRLAAALAFMGDNAKILLTFGRYVPGLRFVVNTTMGLSDRRLSCLQCARDSKRSGRRVQTPARVACAPSGPAARRRRDSQGTVGQSE